MGEEGGAMAHVKGTGESGKFSEHAQACQNASGGVREGPQVTDPPPRYTVQVDSPCTVLIFFPLFFSLFWVSTPRKNFQKAKTLCSDEIFMNFLGQSITKDVLFANLLRNPRKTA